MNKTMTQIGLFLAETDVCPVDSLVPLVAGHFCLVYGGVTRLIHVSLNFELVSIESWTSQMSLDRVLSHVQLDLGEMNQTMFWNIVYAKLSKRVKSETRPSPFAKYCSLCFKHIDPNPFGPLFACMKKACPMVRETKSKPMEAGHGLDVGWTAEFPTFK